MTPATPNQHSANPSPLSCREANNRVLIIDDNPEIHADFCKILKSAGTISREFEELEAQLLGTATPSTESESTSFMLVHAHDGEQGYRMVREAADRDEPFAVAFVDMRMPPGWDGLRTIEAIRSVDPDLMIVVCTAYADHTWEQISSRAGELDRLLVLKKPFDPVEVKAVTRSLARRWAVSSQARSCNEHLSAIVREQTAQLDRERQREVARLNDIDTAIEQRTNELRRLALHDALTGLPNRVMLHERLTREIKRATLDASHGYAVFFIDFDRFKSVNDTLGHRAGDALLSLLGHRLEESLRFLPLRQPAGTETSLAARLGGDEFCVLVSGQHDDATLEAIGESILKAVSRPCLLDAHDVISSVSIGIARGIGRCYQSPADVLRDADAAMYRAKSLGRGRCALFDGAMQAAYERRVHLGNDVAHAIERGEFDCFFQPVVSLAAGSVRSADALLRWRHPRYGILLPHEFLNLSGPATDVNAVGRWLLRTACERFAKWRNHNTLSIERLGVRLCRQQFGDAGLPGFLKATLAEAGVEPSSLVLETSEDVLLDLGEPAERMLATLRALGVRLQICEFGARGGSLALLRRVEVDGLKLDRSFIDQRVFSRRSAAIVRSAVSLAMDLGVELIADGVESIEQVALLQTLGCEAAQGFLFARPMDASHVEVAARSNRWVTPIASGDTLGNLAA